MAVSSHAVSVTNAATRLDTDEGPSNRANRVTSVALYNNGSVTVYVGGADVTSSSGLPLPAGQYMSVDVDRSEGLYGRTASSTADVRVLEENV